jgi:hypothetical protein
MSANTNATRTFNWELALAITLVLIAALSLPIDRAAAGLNDTPTATPVFTVTCAIDGEQVVFHLVGTGIVAGHVLEDNSIAVLLNATFTTYVNGKQISQSTFITPGEGRPGVQCSAFAEFEDEFGDTVRIEVTEAEILLTPPGR